MAHPRGSRRRLVELGVLQFPRHEAPDLLGGAHGTEQRQVFREANLATALLLEHT